MKAMIFAAGFGTRLKPITDYLPKALVPVQGKPLLEYTINKLKQAGVKDIIINVHHFPDQIIDFLKSKNNFNINIEISDERNRLLDTGGGIKCTEHFFDDGKPFIIHNVDILSNVDLQEVYNQHLLDADRLVTLVVSRRDTYRYLLFDQENKLNGWVNTKTNETKPFSPMEISHLQRFAYAGIQVVSPEIFRIMKSEEDIFPIMDFYLQNCRKEKICGYAPNDLQILDVGKVGSLENADKFLQSLDRGSVEVVKQNLLST